MHPLLLRDTRLEIDLDMIAHNTRLVLAELSKTAGGSDGGKSPQLTAVLKADAYGLGAVRVAGVLLECGVALLAVASLPEAVELRRHYPEARLMVMGHTPDRLLEHCVRHNFVTTIFDLNQARLLSAAAQAAGKSVTVHIKVDSGMNRLGIKPDAETGDLLKAIASLPGLAIEGIFTHLALCDRASDQAQFELFMSVVAQAAQNGLTFRYRHICDSIGFLRYPEYRLDMIRAGAILYGAPPLKLPPERVLDIRLPFALKTRISRLRRLQAGEGVSYDHTWKAPAGGASLATLPIGYADGYKRCLSNKASVLIRGQRAPVVGLINMDQCAADVSAVAGAAEGDEVTLLGGDGAGNEIPLLELANLATTNRNEIFSSIGRRVPRVYYRNGSCVAVDDYLNPGEQA